MRLRNRTSSGGEFAPTSGGSPSTLSAGGIHLACKIHPAPHGIGHDLNVRGHEVFDGFRRDLSDIRCRNTRVVPMGLKQEHLLLESHPSRPPPDVYPHS